MLRVVVIALCILVLSCTSRSGNHELVNERFDINHLPVFYSEKHPELRMFAERVSEYLASPAPMSMSRNPVCCIWLQMTGWSPNPGWDGYIILVQPGGVRIEGSNIQQVELAVERIINELDKTGGELSGGIFTNYRVKN